MRGLLILAEFVDAEVRTDAGEPCVAQDLAQFGTFVFGEAGESVVGVANRRAQLDRLKSGVGKLLDRAGKIFGDHFRTGQVWHPMGMPSGLA